MKTFRAALAVLILVSSAQVFAGEDKNSVITFRDSPSKAIRVERMDNDRVFFFECDAGVADGIPAVSNCQSIGEKGGYAASDIDARGRKLRALKWVKNLVVIPAGVVCSALLAGQIGAYQMIQALLGVGADLGNQGADSFTRLEILLPMEIMLVPIAAVAYGAVGAAGGLAASVGLNYFTMPGLKQGSQAMLFASRKADVPNLVLKGKIENYRETLEKALNGVKPTLTVSNAVELK